MGGCPCKTFTVNRGQEAGRKCIEPFIFSVSDAENVLMEADLGDYLLYRDYTTDRILLSVRYYSHIRHHRISQDNGLYFLNGQPYPYLDSIVLYHRQHRLDSLKLKKQAQLSARVVRLFAHKVTSTNGNNVYTLNNEIPPLPPSQQQQQQQLQQHATTPTNNNNNNIVDDLNRINHINNNNNNQHHQQDNHPYSYTNAVFQADDDNEPETEIQSRVTNNSNNNNNNNANDGNDANSVSQIDIQTSPTLPPTHVPSTNHNLLLSSLHSNGAAIAIPATNHVTTATTPISTPNNNTTTTTKTVIDDEIETETETELKSSDTPGNTTPTENALESPQPETFFHKFPQNNDVVKTETDANANNNKQHNKQTLIWTPSLNNDYIEASKRLIIAASPLKSSLFEVNKKPEVETTAKTTLTTSPYKNNNSISETKNNLILSPTSTKLNLKPNVTSLSKNSSFSGRPYLFLSQTPSHKKLTTGANGVAKPPRRAHSFLSTSSSSSSKRKSDMMIAQDTDNNSIALSSWTPLPPINGAGSALSEFDDSTVGSHVSLISISTSSESKVIYSERL